MGEEGKLQLLIALILEIIFLLQIAGTFPVSGNQFYTLICSVNELRAYK